MDRWQNYCEPPEKEIGGKTPPIYHRHLIILHQLTLIITELALAY